MSKELKHNRLTKLMYLFGWGMLATGFAYFSESINNGRPSQNITWWAIALVLFFGTGLIRYNMKAKDLEASV